MISTKGRYALRVMVYLAEHNDGNYMPLKEIATNQDISKKYLEGIMSSLSKAGLITGVHGKGGGYMLNKAPSDYSVFDILDVTEKSLAPVACLTNGAKPCERAADCRTLPVWQGLQEVMNDYLKGITLQDLIQEENVGDYVI